MSVTRIVSGRSEYLEPRLFSKSSIAFAELSTMDGLSKICTYIMSPMFPD